MARSIFASTPSREHRRLLGIVALILVTGAFLGHGCSDTPTEVVDLGAVEAVDDGSIAAGGLALSGGGAATVQEFDASKTFSPGSTGRLRIAAGIILVVGAGAIDGPTTISAHVEIHQVDSSTEHVYLTFGPHMDFNEPIELKVDENLIDGLEEDDGSFILWYLDEATDDWVFSDLGEQHGHKIVFEIDHFSKYGIDP